MYRDRSVCGGRNKEGVVLDKYEISDAPLVSLSHAFVVLVVLEHSAVHVVVHLREGGGKNVPFYCTWKYVRWCGVLWLLLWKRGSIAGGGGTFRAKIL